MKGKTTLVLATDEDREGESISWHLLQVLAPAKGVEIKRIAFHEITKEAIRHALDHPRQVDLALVEAHSRTLANSGPTVRLPRFLRCFGRE